MKFYKNVDQVGDRILVRGYDGGREVRLRDEFFPTLYVKAKEETGYTTLEGDPVKPIGPGTIRESRQFCERYQDVEGFEVYGHQTLNSTNGSMKTSLVKLNMILVRSACLRSILKPQRKMDSVTSDLLIRRSYLSRLRTSYWNLSRLGFPDVQDFQKSKYRTRIVLMSRNIAEVPRLVDRELSRCNYRLERPLFDVPYICNRLSRILGDKNMKLLSPWKLLRSREINILNRKQLFDVSGITVLDYLDLYKKFTYTNQESYRLDHIAMVELGQQKLDHSEFDTFREFYTNDWKKFVDYNIHDVRLVDRLEDKMKLMDLAFTLLMMRK